VCCSEVFEKHVKTRRVWGIGRVVTRDNHRGAGRREESIEVDFREPILIIRSIARACFQEKPAWRSERGIVRVVYRDMPDAGVRRDVFVIGQRSHVATRKNAVVAQATG
jgi:hypothetical protein